VRNFHLLSDQIEQWW